MSKTLNIYQAVYQKHIKWKKYWIIENITFFCVCFWKTLKYNSLFPAPKHICKNCVLFQNVTPNTFLTLKYDKCGFNELKLTRVRHCYQTLEGNELRWLLNSFVLNKKKRNFYLCLTIRSNENTVNRMHFISFVIFSFFVFINQRSEKRAKSWNLFICLFF